MAAMMRATQYFKMPPAMVRQKVLERTRQSIGKTIRRTILRLGSASAWSGSLMMKKALDADQVSDIRLVMEVTICVVDICPVQAKMWLWRTNLGSSFSKTFVERRQPGNLEDRLDLGIILSFLKVQEHEPDGKEEVDKGCKKGKM